MILMSRHPSFGETVSGRQTACAGRHPAFIAGVKIGRAALWDFSFFEKLREKLFRGMRKKGLTKMGRPAIIIFVDTASVSAV